MGCKHFCDISPGFVSREQMKVCTCMGCQCLDQSASRAAAATWLHDLSTGVVGLSATRDSTGSVASHRGCCACCVTKPGPWDPKS
jgi:hypothetical protein